VLAPAVPVGGAPPKVLVEPLVPDEAPPKVEVCPAVPTTLVPAAPLVPSERGGLPLGCALQAANADRVSAKAETIVRARISGLQERALASARMAS
jgi:hypothetical protein